MTRRHHFEEGLSDSARAGVPADASLSRKALVPPGEGDRRFRVYTRFNDPSLLHGADLKRRIHTFPESYFPSTSLPDRLARSLAAARVLHLKELLESFEFFYRVRRRLRRPTMVDLCAGHGLTGLLFAMCEPTVTQVILLDSKRPTTQPSLVAAVTELAPWVGEKVEYRIAGLDEHTALPEGAGVLCVHGCGPLSDLALDAAVRAKGPVAIMPCCYSRARGQSLPGLVRALSADLACDVARTYRLHGEGYQVDWTAIPAAITPKHRVIVGWQAQSR